MSFDLFGEELGPARNHIEVTRSGVVEHPGEVSPSFRATCFWSPDTNATPLNINDIGQIVGMSQILDNNGNFVSQRAAIWENGTVIDLQTLVPAGTLPLTFQTGNINNRGEIAVNATNPDGSPAALLLVPKH